MKYLSINKKYIASNVVGQLCAHQASFIYQDLNKDAIFFIPHANLSQHRVCYTAIFFFWFYVQTCQFFCWLLHLQHAVICCLVNGLVMALNSQGIAIWKVNSPPPHTHTQLCCVFVARAQRKYICIVVYEKRTTEATHINFVTLN